MGVGLYEEFRQRIAAVVDLCKTLLSQQDGTLNLGQCECLRQVHNGILQFLEKLNRLQTQSFSLRDLRTPLAGVIGFAQMLTEEIEGTLSLAHHYARQQVLDHSRYILTQSAHL